jgi:hypothetical protein
MKSISRFASTETDFKNSAVLSLHHVSVSLWLETSTISLAWFYHIIAHAVYYVNISAPPCPKNPPPVPILSQIDPGHTSQTTSRGSILILSSHLRLGFPIGLLPSGFPTKALYAPVLSLICYMPSLSQCSWFDRPKSIWWAVQTIKLPTV